MSAARLLFGPETSAHRNLGRKRQRCRARLRKTGYDCTDPEDRRAAETLDKHHGSSSPSMASEAQCYVCYGWGHKSWELVIFIPLLASISVEAVKRHPCFTPNAFPQLCPCLFPCAYPSPPTSSPSPSTTALESIPLTFSHYLNIRSRLLFLL